MPTAKRTQTRLHVWLTRIIVPALAMSTACYGNSDSFIRAAAKHGCKRTRECEKSNFERLYEGDLGECRDDAEDAAQHAYDIAEDLGCEYVPEEGRECIKALRHLRRDCSADADQEIAQECGVTILDLTIDYLDCG